MFSRKSKINWGHYGYYVFFLYLQIKQQGKENNKLERFLEMLSPSLDTCLYKIESGKVKSILFGLQWKSLVCCQLTIQNPVSVIIMPPRTHTHAHTFLPTAPPSWPTLLPHCQGKQPCHFLLKHDGGERDGWLTELDLIEKKKNSKPNLGINKIKYLISCKKFSLSYIHFLHNLPYP